MTDHPDNPPSNRLPPGISEDKLIAAVRKSGYPLQTAVAHALGSQFTVVEEWGYTDRETETHRTLDVYAFRYLAAQEGGPRLHLLVECKRSDFPFVFFVPGVDRLPRDYPQVIGCSGHQVKVTKGVQNASPSSFFCAAELPFIQNGPTISTALARVESNKEKKVDLSGSVPFNQVMMPLASAADHLRRVFAVGTTAPMIVLPICVVDAAMVVARGTPEDPTLRAEPWVRVLHQEAAQKGAHWVSRHYTVDFVHRDYLGPFVEQHAIPFATALVERIVSFNARSPRPSVPRPHNLSWDEFMKTEFG